MKWLALLLPLLFLAVFVFAAARRVKVYDSFAGGAAGVFPLLRSLFPYIAAVLVKPFSGSGSLSLLSRLCSQYGADSYIARCACAVYASGETVFYLSAVYFASAEGKRPFLPVAVALASNLAAAALGCLFCRLF